MWLFYDWNSFHLFFFLNIFFTCQKKHTDSCLYRDKDYWNKKKLSLFFFISLLFSIIYSFWNSIFNGSDIGTGLNWKPSSHATIRVYHISFAFLCLEFQWIIFFSLFWIECVCSNSNNNIISSKCVLSVYICVCFFLFACR